MKDNKVGIASLAVEGLLVAALSALAALFGPWPLVITIVFCVLAWLWLHGYLRFPSWNPRTWRLGVLAADIQDHGINKRWIVVEAGAYHWDNSLGVAARRVGVMIAGAPQSERLIVSRLTVTNQSNKTVGFTANLKVLYAGGSKSASGEVSGPDESGYSQNYWTYPLRLGEGDVVSRPIAFDVRIGRPVEIDRCVLTLRDQLHDPPREAVLDVPGAYP